MKYAELIVKSKEEKDQALAVPRAAEQSAAIGIAVAKLDLEVQTAKNELEGLKSTYPLEIDTIIAQLDQVALQERRLQQLKALATELFGS